MNMVWQLRTAARGVQLSKQHVLLRKQMAVSTATGAFSTMANSATAMTCSTRPTTAAAAMVATSNHPTVWSVCRSFSAAAAPPAAEIKPKQYSVKDRIVHLTIVDPSGARKQITGLVGT
jgi:hypothetical protein